MAARIGGWPVAASLAAHGLLLAALSGGSPPAPAGVPVPGGGLQIRLVASGAVAGDGAVAVESPLEPTQFAAGAAAATGSDPAAADPDPGADAMTVPPSGAEAGPPRADSGIPAMPPPGPDDPAHAAVPLPPDAAQDGPAAGAGYLPRRALTRAPQPLGDPAVVVPAGHGDAGEQRGIFTLFINATGGVDAVVPDGPTLAPPVEEEARRVLGAVRFVPGEVDGRAVAALIRIEIVFENRPPVAPSGPVIVSQQPL